MQIFRKLPLWEYSLQFTLATMREGRGHASLNFCRMNDKALPRGTFCALLRPGAHPSVTSMQWEDVAYSYRYDACVPAFPEPDVARSLIL